MNHSVPPPKPRWQNLSTLWPGRWKDPTLTPVRGADREFLPAALEILETPPSPLPSALMWTICAFVAVALVWSFFGRLDVHAIAWGKIEVNGRTKVIQPLEPGKVIGLHAENGRVVREGELLVELDSTEVQADVTAATESLAASNTEVARRRIAIETVAQLRPASPQANVRLATLLPLVAPRIPVTDAVPAAIRLREDAVLAADLAGLRDTIANLDKQSEQKIATRKRLEASIAYQTTLISTLEGRVDMRESSIKLNVGTKVNLFDAKESLQKSQAQLASDSGQLAEVDAALEEVWSQKIRAISQFVQDNEAKLAEAARKADETSQLLAKARAKLGRTRLTAPINGVTQQVGVTTIGQVVTTGQQLMSVTPQGGALQLEAYVSNIDIGFVRPGQRAVVKLDAFPFTRYGTIEGKVLKIAAEAIDEQEAKRSLSNAVSASATPNQSNSAPGQTPSFVFPVTIALEATTILIEGTAFPLTPGMTSTAEIKTESRRVIDYFLSPIAKVTSEALKER